MRISQRLFLAVVPAVLGVLLVAALAYWGAFDRAAPGWVIVIAAISTVGSLVIAWQNTRYVAHRIERLAAARAHRPPTRSPRGASRNAALPGIGMAPDELDVIEDVVDRLNSAVTVAEADSRAREQAAAERVNEYAVLLDEAAATVRRQLDDARMALHILAEHHFGSLNENQEEMVEAARMGAMTAENELARLQAIAHIDSGALHARRDPLRVTQLLQSLRPQLESDASRSGVTLAIDLLPGPERIIGDRVRLQEALELLLRHLVRHALPGASMSIRTANEPGAIRIAVSGGKAPILDADITLARRVIEAHRGRIEVGPPETVVVLPTSRQQP